MKSLIVFTFLVLGLVFYELSGGSDFDPKATLASRVDMNELPASQVQSEPEVSRVALDLARIEPTPVSKPAVVSSASLGDVQKADAAPKSSIILPSLVTDAVVITPVDFGSEEAELPAATSSDAPDIRTVSGSRVNLRNGPGTGYSVLTSLGRGTEVEVLENSGDGWVQLRPVDGGPVGWMAERLLTKG